jgi:hypothetical protein
MLSKYTITYLPKICLRIYVITRMKIPSVLVNQNGITSHSNKLSFVLKAIFHSSPGQI